MQLSAISKVSGETSMDVDFFPILGSTSFIYKVLKFRGDTMSTSCIRTERFYTECVERIGLGYVVTGFNTEPVNVNPMNGVVYVDD